MFADAYMKAKCFTLPVVISTRFFDGSVECGCGAYVVLNDEGWIMTVAHIWESHFAHKSHLAEIDDYNKKLQAIEQSTSFDAKHKRKKIAQLQSNPRWITNHSFWWGIDGAQLKDIKPLPDGDLVIGRLEPFDPKRISSYPILKDPTTNLNNGTSLCKLGFPFHEIKATFDPVKNAFALAPGSLPLPLFPIDGIFTRQVFAGKSKDGKYDIKFIETSSPGLRGQSGGPIYDTKGTIWALQSRTSHFPLGFSPTIKKKGIDVEENQFLNVGWGVHIELIVSFLREHGVKFSISTY
ncbi:MAG: hypothetical protein A2X57_01005 [Nitrospirae bacterium GWD2_57_8]|nr:MAG: hypothetical protein A2X57_01005 [Nitrospirae bacterium GWD2_57_8]